jgi:hypothetical protein
MQGKVISEIVYYYSEHIYYSEPTKNPKMQRVENDRSVEAELSDGQYRVLENSWISKVSGRRRDEINRPGASADEVRLWEESDVVPTLATLLPFGGG